MGQSVLRKARISDLRRVQSITELYRLRYE